MDYTRLYESGFERPGRDFFVAFPCRARVVCPSCKARCSLFFGEKVLEIVHPLNTDTLPTPSPNCFAPTCVSTAGSVNDCYTAHSRLGRNTYVNACKSAPASVAGFYLQTHCSFFNFHSLVHALVLPKLVMDGSFHKLKGFSAATDAVSFR